MELAKSVIEVADLNWMRMLKVDVIKDVSCTKMRLNESWNVRAVGKWFENT